jgi:hypothetical protein
VVINQRFVSLFHRKCLVSAADEPGRMLALAVNSQVIPGLFPMLFKIAMDPSSAGGCGPTPPGARVCDDAVQYCVAP